MHPKKTFSIDISDAIFNIEDILTIFSEQNNILDYSEDELYEALVEKGASIPKINQILKLRKIEYPMVLSRAISLSVDELRGIINNAKYERKKI